MARSPGAPQVPFFRDPKLRAIIYQVVLCVVLGALVYAAVRNAAENLARAKIASGFGFWNTIAGFDISQTLIEYSAQSSTYGRAFWVGLTNTLLVAGLGIMLATVLGTVIGVARLSKNFLVERLASGYVELIRNVPLLLQLLFWYNAVLKALPDFANGFTFPGGVLLNNRGLYLPRPLGVDGWHVGGVIALAVALGFAFNALAARSAGRLRMLGLRFAVTLLIVVGIPVLALIAMGAPLEFEYPKASRFNVRGGVEILPEFVALLVGLVIYTAAFIAEVVRAGLMSVSRGQTEAAQALGLGPLADAALHHHAAGDAGDHSAAHQPVSQSHQELLARGRDRLSRPRADLHRHGAQHHRPGDRGRGHHHGGVPGLQPGHLVRDEPLQRARRAGGTMTTLDTALAPCRRPPPGCGPTYAPRRRKRSRLRACMSDGSAGRGNICSRAR